MTKDNRNALVLAMAEMFITKLQNNLAMLEGTM